MSEIILTGRKTQMNKKINNGEESFKQIIIKTHRALTSLQLKTDTVLAFQTLVFP